MEFTLENMYKDLIKFSYCSFDRIVIRGHVPMLQGTDGGGIVTWARSLDPNIILTNSWFESLAAKFHINVKKFAQEHNIPIISCNQNQEKNEVAKTYLPKDQNFIGVYLIIKSREMTYSFASQKSIHNKNPQHRNITRQDRCVDHFYFYLLDQYWGPISIRFSSHLPFNVKVFLNGNRWLSREASRKGVNLKSNDNAIIHCDNPTNLQAIADSLIAKKIQSVCDHWVYRLLPVLSYKERNKSAFHYQWFLHHIEFAHNMVFKSPWNLTKLFQRHLAVNYEHFHPRQIESFFGHRHRKTYDKVCNLRLYHQTEAVSVIRMRSKGCSLKQYNKLQRIFRSEITVTNVRDLHIYKAIANLNKLKERMSNILCSFQAIQSSVHQATATRGELSALAQPGKQGKTCVPGIKLDNERIMSLVAILPCLVRFPEGFRITDLRDILCQITQKQYTTAQVSYDLRKLRAKNLLCRIPKQKRYMLTHRGATVAVVLSRLTNSIFNPVINLSLNHMKSRMPDKLTAALDQHYYNIEKELLALKKELNLQMLN